MLTKVNRIFLVGDTVRRALRTEDKQPGVSLASETPSHSVNANCQPRSGRFEVRGC